MHSFTDTVSYFADPDSHDLLASLFGEQEEGDWQSRGLCAQTDPEAFFPAKGDSAREAKRLCARCPVRAECLAYALANNEQHGVWGGLSERERRRLPRATPAAESLAEGEKRCRACQKIRPASEFYEDPRASDGLKSSCKGCCRQMDRRRRSRCVAA
jgi:WhiB family redox-sensing transcriptional regulator